MNSKTNRKQDTKKPQLPKISKDITAQDSTVISTKENTKPELSGIRKGSAPKIRNSTQLIHYGIGKSNGTDVLQLISNTNNGLFSDELIAIESIQKCLSGLANGSTFTSRIFHSLFKQKSNNNAGFLGAVLR
ncbi:hypothetical protein L2729_02220 [Shewanella gelidimarina]|uniref:hypothetical protein n=1 Tax=Shewanella gelidimarina TaxID=56813 RepID=UPI00200DFB64|nr:hypothetical protein [Shewanella gelidimarina]MCL1056806.1 hypothetical protein [Shewanella gelidimarina]